MDNWPVISEAMQSRLALLKGYLADESLTGSERDEVLEHVVGMILRSVNDETGHGRVVVLEYLHLLGFGHLIEGQS